MDGSGNLYGTARSGGAGNAGTVFEVVQGSGTISTLASFNGAGCSLPIEGVIMDGSGNLYGTATGGGSNGRGAVFELAHGSGTITTLASFTYSTGQFPSGVIMDSSGNLYGTTSAAAAGSGAVYEVAHGSGTVTTLASFNSSSTGGYPYAPPIMDGSGNLYGTAHAGGAYSDGTVYEVVNGSGAITVLGTFNGTNGATPYGPLIMDTSGNLYGTTTGGGANNVGTVFELMNGSGTITTLASFNGSNGSGPQCGLLMDGNGNLYGTTASGGAYSDGTVFEVARGSGTITTLASFNGANGSSPQASLIMDSSGNLYGTTNSGGASNNGTVFEVVSSVSYSITGFQSPTTAGTSGSFTVTVLNPDGTTDTGYTGTIHFTSTDPQAALPADYAFQSSDQGVHTFTATLYTSGSRAITGSDTSNSMITGADGPITVTAAAATHFSIAAPASAKRGKAFNVTVTALDAYGNVAAGYTGTVHFTSSDTRATLPANYTFTATDAGVHTFSVTLNSGGSQSITVRDTMNSSITGTVSIQVNGATPVPLLAGATGLGSKELTLALSRLDLKRSITAIDALFSEPGEAK
jgi:uncharacterized repeat protein (TIGR03803 family)